MNIKHLAIGGGKFEAPLGAISKVRCACRNVLISSLLACVFSLALLPSLVSCDKADTPVPNTAQEPATRADTTVVPPSAPKGCIIVGSLVIDTTWAGRYDYKF